MFSLLLGYREPPAGITIREGLHYNPYFIGGAIAMPKMLADGGVEYEDGTPATESQQAKVRLGFIYICTAGGTPHASLGSLGLGSPWPGFCSTHSLCPGVREFQSPWLGFL